MLECSSFVLDLSQPLSISTIYNCSVINGNLIVTRLSNTQCRQGGISLPNLLEILGALTIEHSGCQGDLSNFLPNLASIHGITMFTPPLFVMGKVSLPQYALLIHHTALSGIGLHCLRVLGFSGVLLLENPQMCYVDTVGWNLLAQSPKISESLTSLGGNQSAFVARSSRDEDIVRSAGLYDLCANACPPTCDWIRMEDLPRTLCWSQTQCQTGGYTFLSYHQVL